MWLVSFVEMYIHVAYQKRQSCLCTWSKDGILPVDELERMINMSLLKLNEDGVILELHDQLRDMGRLIAKSTRIWKGSMIPDNEFTNKVIFQ